MYRFFNLLYAEFCARAGGNVYVKKREIYCFRFEHSCGSSAGDCAFEKKILEQPFNLCTYGAPTSISACIWRLYLYLVPCTSWRGRIRQGTSEPPKFGIFSTSELKLKIYQTHRKTKGGVEKWYSRARVVSRGLRRRFLSSECSGTFASCHSELLYTRAQKTCTYKISSSVCFVCRL